MPWLIVVLAALAASVTMAEPVELTLNQAAQSVVLLHAPAAAGATSLGSGFVVNLNGRLFLVTAEHVSKDIAGQGACGKWCQVLQ